MMIYLMLCTEKCAWKSKSKQECGLSTIKICCKSFSTLVLNAHATFSGSLLWQYFHPGRSVRRACGRWVCRKQTMASYLNEFDQKMLIPLLRNSPREDLFDGNL
jgi:hypothetical protein